MDGKTLRGLWMERRERIRGQTNFDLDEALDSAEEDASAFFTILFRSSDDLDLCLSDSDSPWPWRHA